MMFSTLKAHKLRIFVHRKKDGALRRYGKIRHVVFHPTKPLALGVIVRRPDILWMFKRKERFVAFDRLDACSEGYIITDTSDAFDNAACKRLGVDYDECLLWEYMPCVNEAGKSLGVVASVSFSTKTYLIDHIDISSSAGERMLVGERNIDASHIKGYKDGAIVVDVDYEDIKPEGGVAADAGKAWATTKKKASDVRKSTDQKATKFADEAGDKAEVAGKKAAKQVSAWGKMFKDFKSEYDKANKKS